MALIPAMSVIPFQQTRIGCHLFCPILRITLALYLSTDKAFFALCLVLLQYKQAATMLLPWLEPPSLRAITCSAVHFRSCAALSEILY